MFEQKIGDLLIGMLSKGLKDKPGGEESSIFS